MPDRVLAIQIQQPGDAILTTPALRYLIDQGHEVHLLAQPTAAILLQNMPGIKTIYALARGNYAWRSDFTRATHFFLKPFHQTYIFSQCNDRNLLWAFLSHSQKKVAPYQPQLPFWILKSRITWIKKLPCTHHEVEQHLHLVGAPPHLASNLDLEYHPSQDALALAQSLLNKHHIPIRTHLHIHLTARWASKCWPQEHFIRFIKRLTTESSFPLFLTCGPDKEELRYSREIIDHFPSLPHALGTLNPNQLGALIAQSRAFFGMDSMPMHLAAALKIPGVALFGMSVPENFGPWHAPIKVLSSPCHCRETGKRTCPRSSQTDCLKAITPDQAYQAITEQIQRILPG